MKAKMVAFLSWLYKSVLGELITMLLSNATSQIFKALTDRELNKRAIEYVKKLNARKDLDTAAKAKEFNRMMADWGKSVGKELKDSTINCLREFAVSALKSKVSL